MSTAITATHKAAIEPKQEQPTAMQLLGELAKTTDPQVAIAVAQQIANLQIQMEEQSWKRFDREDRIRFNDAMKAFKDNMPTIVRSREIKKSNGELMYKAVALEDVAGPVMKALTELDVTYRFKSTDLPDGRIRVTCYLRLKGTAYEEEGASLAAPPDVSGGKDPLKAVGSTVSYLEKYTLLQSIGMHVYGADPEAVQAGGVTNDEGSDWINKISLSDSPGEAMKVWTDAINAAKKFTPIDYKAMTLFTEARDKRLLEIKSARGQQ